MARGHGVAQPPLCQFSDCPRLGTNVVGVQVCQLGGRHPIEIPSTGVGVRLTFARFDVGANPDDLTSLEI